MRSAASSTIPALDRALHWIIAVAILAMIPLGLMAEEMEKGPVRELVFNTHIALGLAVLVLGTWRFGRRLADGPPEPAGRPPMVERALSHLIHGLLLAATILAPLSGIARIVGRGRPLEVFGVTLLPTGPGNEAAAAIARAVHSGPVLVLGLSLVILLHVVGALKHHFVDRDDTLMRMLGRTRSV
jgi:cytochrome b561